MSGHLLAEVSLSGMQDVEDHLPLPRVQLLGVMSDQSEQRQCHLIHHQSMATQ